MDIAGISALVTGGASGLGAASARRLAELGAKVGIVDLNGDGAKAVGAEIGGTGVGCDVTSPDAMEAALAEISDAVGVPRVLVNCAGIGVAGRIVGRGGPMPLEDFTRVVDINLFGSFNAMRLAVAAMSGLDPNEVGERGVVVNTASVAAYDGQIGQAAYAASKGAIASITLPAAREFARMGVRVMTIAPGILQTPMFDNVPDAVREGLLSITQFPARLGLPEEYAHLVQHIVENPLLNGETIRLDGAVRLPPR
ncbi:MAG: SDR family NAD(P)-dependent oxidoreductase [Defluviicoccus sp.]|nr:SDR family NAD(P)-dependent oxidoreductase [Defluviicoccus sp.]MDE0384542.1 SDR family NAD(P)-dependent oxidoreductase [Defluviicoccus sp.]